MVSKSSAHSVRSAEQTPQRDGLSSRHSSLRDTTTIDAGMTRTTDERERTIPDAMARSSGPRLSAEDSSGQANTSHVRKRNAISARATC